MSDEDEELRRRVAELERRVAVLFQQTGAADWEADARSAPPDSDEVRLLLGQATAALGEIAKELRDE